MSPEYRRFFWDFLGFSRILDMVFVKSISIRSLEIDPIKYTFSERGDQGLSIGIGRWVVSVNW